MHRVGAIVILGLLGQWVLAQSTDGTRRWNRPIPGESIEPVWIGEGDSFWYRWSDGEGRSRIVLVDPTTRSRRVVTREELPKGSADRTPERTPENRRNPAARAPSPNPVSPNGKFRVTVRDFNVFLSEGPAGAKTQLSYDGHARDGYLPEVWWSPDSTMFAMIRLVPGAERAVTLIESSPEDQAQPRTVTFAYLKPGDAIPLRKPRLFNAITRREIPTDDRLFPMPWDISGLRWGGQELTFRYNQRGHQVMRVIGIDGTSGRSRAIINEESATFFDYNAKLFDYPLPVTGERLWMSERSGWNHLYLVDAKSGSMKPITAGDWLVRQVDRVDEASRTIWFRAMGLFPGQDPYHIHFAKVNFDGRGLTILTAGDGTHTVQWSPNGKWFIDTWSRVDLPPRSVLRDAEGNEIVPLETADVRKLEADGWRPPERFVAKGRDGKTDIYGYLVKPSHFDPAKRYPVVEHIYAGPHDHHVGKSFRAVRYEQSVAEAGFIVVKIDGMGTNWRSKAFHDVAWKNLADAGFPDRIPWIKAAAKERPWMNLDRGCGLFGGSAGGQNTLAGLLRHPDFYTVGVSDCGCHDNRMDKIWWNELWMGWPLGPHYDASSNVTHAHRLQGKLLLTVGEKDTNVDPASTMQVVDRLIKANKDFDMLVVPGGGHGIAESPYGRRRRLEFLVKHLQPEARTP